MAGVAVASRVWSTAAMNIGRKTATNRFRNSARLTVRSGSGVRFLPALFNARSLPKRDDALHLLAAQHAVGVLVEKVEVVAELRVSEHLAERQYAVAIRVERAEGIRVRRGRACRRERI